YLMDTSRNMYVLLPLKGGTAYWGYINGFKTWYKMYQVTKVTGNVPDVNDEGTGGKEAKKEEDNTSEMSSGMVAIHNQYRATVGSPAVSWDAGIAGYAQEWANYLKSKNCSMEHRPRSGTYKQKYGENLAWASGMNLSPNSVVKMWYDEVKDYQYSTNSCKPGKVCGHYTQVVWKNSQRIGCAMAKCGQAQIWVCNYDPPGNWVGQKPY
ncbi:MAG: pathogenesis-related family 1 protein, partial [Leptospiraceae bacterium]|nr:pathogenesis-related family 1 protein [Leptospiraceae bacterium]